MKRITRGDAAALERLLHKRGRMHLHVTARGDHLTVSSHEDGQPEPRLRFTALPAGRYGVSFRHHSGRWEPAPISGSLIEALDAIEAIAGWHLDPWGAPGTNF